MTGARSLLAHIVPTVSHARASLSKGYDPAGQITALDSQIRDCVALCRHLIEECRRANPGDPNIETLQDVLRALA